MRTSIPKSGFQTAAVLKLVLAALLSGMLSTAQASSFKCGNRFVELGDSKASVLVRCGEPLFAEVVSGNDETKVEQWTYKSKGYRGFLRVLTFRAGQLVNIRVGERQ